MKKRETIFRLLLIIFPISQFLFRNYKSILPNSLAFFILNRIESVQLENLLRIGVRKEEGACSDLLTCSDSKRFKDDKMKRNENNVLVWGRCFHLWFQRRVRLVSRWTQNHKHSGGWHGKKKPPPRILPCNLFNKKR